MECRMTKEMMILPGCCDSSARLGVADTFGLFMDLAAEHAVAIGNGPVDMQKRGLFWLTVKTRIRFFRRPGITEVVTASTWPESVGKKRGNRSYTLSKNGELLVAGKSEWAILELDGGGLHDVMDVYAPDTVFPDESAVPGLFTRVHDNFTDEPFARYTVHSTDIDLGGHMNNAAYPRALASLFPVAKQRDLNIREAEIHFRTPCYEGDTLAFQKRRAEDGALEIRAALPSGKTALLIRLITD